MKPKFKNSFFLGLINYSNHFPIKFPWHHGLWQSLTFSLFRSVSWEQRKERQANKRGGFVRETTFLAFFILTFLRAAPKLTELLRQANRPSANKPILQLKRSIRPGGAHGKKVNLVPRPFKKEKPWERGCKKVFLYKSQIPLKLATYRHTGVSYLSLWGEK